MTMERCDYPRGRGRCTRGVVEIDAYGKRMCADHRDEYVINLDRQYRSLLWLLQRREAPK